jgi:uncharacterized protein YbjT (DUF2867 family)
LPGADGLGWSGRCGGRAAGGADKVEPFVFAVPAFGQVQGAAGAGRLAYTSVLRAGSAQLAIAPEHKVTEQAITQSNVPFTFLRNSFCTENYTAQIPSILARGATVRQQAALSSRLPHESAMRLPASPH